MNSSTENLSTNSRVIVAECPSYVVDDISSALAEIMQSLGGMASLITAGQTVLIKPNLFSPHSPDDAVTTHPEIVRQVVRLCFDAGAGRVWVGDSPVGTHVEKKLWDETGMAAAIAGTDAELKSWQVKQSAVACGDDMLAVPEWFPEVDVIISLPKLKTHCLTTITCAIKNMYGVVSGTAKAQFHLKYPSPLTMSEFLVRVFATFKPHLTIADAVVAMEGNGPAHGKPRPVGVLMASRDAVALDAVGCVALGIAPAKVPMIRVAAACGLGNADESRIEAVGSGMPILRKAHMKPSVSRFLMRLPEWAFGGNLRLAKMRPKIRQRLCVKCGMCAEACPRGAITMSGADRFPIIARKQCIDCFCCLESCPKSSIAVQYCLGNLFGITREKPQTRESK